MHTEVQESEEEMGFIRRLQSMHMYSGAATYTPHSYSIYGVHPPLHKGENLKYHHLVSGISHGPESMESVQYFLLLSQNVILGLITLLSKVPLINSNILYYDRIG